MLLVVVTVRQVRVMASHARENIWTDCRRGISILLWVHSWLVAHLTRRVKYRQPWRMVVHDVIIMASMTLEIELDCKYIAFIYYFQQPYNICCILATSKAAWCGLNMIWCLEKQGKNFGKVSLEEKFVGFVSPNMSFYVQILQQNELGRNTHTY